MNKKFFGLISEQVEYFRKRLELLKGRGSPDKYPRWTRQDLISLDILLENLERIGIKPKDGYIDE